MKLLKKYFDLQKKIYDHFGYCEDWVVIPMEDRTDHHWFVDQNTDGTGKVVYSPEPLTVDSIASGEKIFGGSIYTQRFLPKWVYRADDFTMVCVDTHTDGNKFLMVFDNAKEQDDKVLKVEYRDAWS